MIDCKNLVQKLNGYRYKKILGVAVGSEELKLAEVSFAGQLPQVTPLLAKPLPQKLCGGKFFADANAAAQFLQEAISEAGIKIAAAAFAISADNARLVKLAMPYLQADELNEALRWELAQYVPWEDFIFAAGYVTQAAEQAGEVTAVVISGQLANAAEEIAAQAGLTPLGLYLQSMAVQQTLVQQQQRDFILLDCGGANYTLTAFKNALPVKQHSGSLTVPQTRTADAGLEMLTAEIWRMAQDINGDCSLVVNGANAEQITEALKAALNMPAAINDMSQSVVCSAEAAADMLDDFSSAVGTALCAKNNTAFNLLPTAAHKFKLQPWQLYKYAAAACVSVCFLAWAWQLFAFFNVQRDLDEVQEQIAAVGVWQQRYEAAAAENRQLNKRLQELGKLQNNSVDWPALLSGVAGSTPAGCWLQKIEQQEKGGVIITGYASQMEKAVELAESLAAQNGVKSAELTELRSENVSGKNAVRFSLLLESDGTI